MSFLRPWLLLTLFALVPAILLRTGRDASRRSRAAGVLRCIGIALIALASAGPVIRIPTDRVDVVFVLDVSESLGSSGGEEALMSVNRMLRGMDAEDRAGLVAVGEQALTESVLRPGIRTFSLSTEINPQKSNLAGGIYRSLSMFSGVAESRVVLVSDGRASGDDPVEAAELAAAMDIRVDVLPVGPKAGGEVLIRKVDVPGVSRLSESYELSVLLEAAEPTAARVVILKDGDYLGEERLSLAAGETRLDYKITADRKGMTVFEVLLEADVDTNPENNRALAALRVEGPPQLLYIAHDEPSRSLLEALTLQGLELSVAASTDIPDSLESLEAWDALILDNVSSHDLSMKTMNLLELWTRNQGGGLMMVGGDSSFGLGAYHRTPVETILPVEMDSPSSLYIPSLTMVMAVDKSGSMGGETALGQTKLDLIKEAVIGAVEVLNPLYVFGLVAFDADFEWIIPPTEAGNDKEVRDGLAGLQAGGGTKLYPAMKAAYDSLSGSSSSVRHLIILSDGLIESADYDRLLGSMTADDISVSTVAVGTDSDRQRLEHFAQEGGGRFWYAEDADMVPRIFASESMIVSKGLTVEETILPVPGTFTEALEGVDLESFPPLHGYIMTSPKPAALVALFSPRGHPLLAFKNHGLGRSVAFTSNFRGRWGGDLVSWESFPRLAAQTVRWMLRPAGLDDMILGLRPEGSLVVVTVEAREDGGGFRSDLKLEGESISPDQSEIQLDFRQTAPGRYESRFTPDQDGLWRVAVRDEGAGVGLTGTWAQSYSPEHESTGADIAALARIAEAGGGSLLDPNRNIEDLWKTETRSTRTRLDFTFLLSLAALLLFVVDIGLRLLGGSRKTPVPAMDMEAQIRQGLEDERRRPKHAASYWFGQKRRPTASEAARALAENRRKKQKSSRS